MWRLPVCLLLCSSTLAFDFDDEEIAVTDGAAPGAAASGHAEQASAVGKSVQLEHALGNGPFSPRSKLYYRGISGLGGVAASARVSQGMLSGDELSRFEELVSTGGYYTLRLPSSLDGEGSATVFASVSVCALLASRFEEHIHLTMGANGQLLAMSYRVPVVPSRCPSEGLPRIVFDEILYNTTVTLEFPPEGPKPLGKVPDAGFLPAAAAAALAARANSEGKHPHGTGPDGQPAPPKSFLARYWMYILPIVLILITGGGEPPAAGAEGNGGAAGTAGGAGAARGGKKRA